MGKYLKLFENHTQYEQYITGETAVLPNVSHCIDEAEVHYNPLIPPYQGFCKLALNNGDVVEIEGEGELTQAMTSGYSATCVSAEIGELCTSIGAQAFMNCSGLTSVEIPNSVTIINGAAFASCRSLMSITIPNSVTSIGNSAFGGCSVLASVNIGNGVTSIGSQAFAGCSVLASVTIGDSVTSIGTSTFGGCSGLTSVTIGSGITSIGGGAFYNCLALSSVTILATTPPTHVGGCFQNNASGRKIYVPSESVAAYKSASGWSDYGDDIVAIPT